jgi:hypothetical protein
VSVTAADPAYTIAQNLRWFALVYLVALVLTAALAAYLQTINITLPSTGVGIGVYAGVVAVAGHRFANRRDWTGRDRNLLSFGYVAIAVVLSCALAGLLIFVESSPFAAMSSDAMFMGIIAAALLIAALIYYAMARLMLWLIARRLNREASQRR